MTPSEPLIFTSNAHAKLNVLLRVGTKKAGALHTILSVSSELEFGDELDFFNAHGGFTVTGDDPAILPQENLVWRAAQALDRSPPAIRIHVRKRIPVQAGLAGGSADAAAALRGLALLSQAGGDPIPQASIQAAARKAGSDIAACLVPGLKVVEGFGERVRPVSGPLPSWGVVLLKPAAAMPTTRAYELLDAGRAQDSQDALHADPNAADAQRANDVCAALRTGDFAGFCSLVHNDFQDVVERAQAETALARRRLMNCGAGTALLCGSGSCVAGFFETAAAAQTCREALRLNPGEWSAVTRLHDSA